MKGTNLGESLIISTTQCSQNRVSHSSGLDWVVFQDEKRQRFYIILDCSETMRTVVTTPGLMLPEHHQQTDALWLGFRRGPLYAVSTASSCLWFFSQLCAAKGISQGIDGVLARQRCSLLYRMLQFSDPQQRHSIVRLRLVTGVTFESSFAQASQQGQFGFAGIMMPGPQNAPDFRMLGVCCHFKIYIYGIWKT